GPVAESPEPELADASHVTRASTSPKQPVDQRDEQPLVEQRPEPERAVIEAPPHTPEPARVRESVVEHVSGTVGVPSPRTVEARLPEQHASDATPSEIPSIGAHTIAPPGVTDEEYHKSLQHAPFEEEVWAELEEPQVPPARTEARITNIQRE